MTKLLEATLEHLCALVSFDTRNPPRAIGTHGIFDYVRTHLPDFDLTLTDHGTGAVSLLAIRGAPRVLFNVHLDTVPIADGWSADPFALRVAAGRASGLGACDIKGAAAALLAAAAQTHGSAAFLFSTDEEADDARCIAHFLGTARSLDAALIAEPTRGRAVLAHRGYSAVRVQFGGRAGHASDSDSEALNANALHQAVRWSVKALDYMASQADRRYDNLSGLRFNIGRIEGGIVPNVVAPGAEVQFSFRPLPFDEPDELLDALRLLAKPAPAAFEETFRGAPLPSAAKHDAARSVAASLDLPVGAAADFWSEAALFSAAGWPAIVYGPGDIAQAHAADEWVALDELSTYAENIRRIIDRG
ncbi:MAG TPA: acetylornithine deacetylase [Gammaproteobacteria bacterium]|nr:acetylornithine deacetylase [Gammaproteobacteria bacterium]